MKQHHYHATLEWTGNTGEGTRDYKAYSRNHTLQTDGKPVIPGSSDPVFRGDASRYNPEDMLVGATAACHMLWYLHLCAVNNVIVHAYSDHAAGVMDENADGSGQFASITLYPHVVVQDSSMIERAKELHTEAHAMCFIARSLKAPVYHEPHITAIH